MISLLLTLSPPLPHIVPIPISLRLSHFRCVQVAGLDPRYYEMTLFSNAYPFNRLKIAIHFLKF